MCFAFLEHDVGVCRELGVARRVLCVVVVC